MKKKESYSRIMVFFVSLLTASTFWFYVLNSEPLEVERKIPVVFISPKGLSLITETPDTLLVKLKGSRTFIQSMLLKKEKIYVDLRKYNYKKETFVVNLTPSMVPAPFGISVLNISPGQIVLSLEREIRKMVKVRPDLFGKVQENLKLIKKVVEPSEFMIKGPRSIVKKIGMLRTLPIDLSALDGGHGQIPLHLESLDSRVEIEDLGLINLSYELRPNKANMTLKNIPISFLTSRSGFSSRNKFVALDVLVSDKEKFKSIRNADIEVIATLPRKKGRHRVKLKTNLPEGIHLLQIHPESINVLVK